jgi:hypothetical protein
VGNFQKLLEAQIARRSRMYLNSAREAFERAKQRVKVALGMDEVQWVLGQAEHCDGCVAFSDLGWQKVDDDPYNGAFPGSGATQCLTNCQCSLEYRSSEETT